MDSCGSESTYETLYFQKYLYAREPQEIQNTAISKKHVVIKLPDGPVVCFLKA